MAKKTIVDSSIFDYGALSGFYDFIDKDAMTGQYLAYMLNRTQSMFKYEGLPESIPQKFLELFLQTNGHCCIAKYEETLYCFSGSRGGVPDVYYQPTRYIVANPALKMSHSYVIDSECVVIPNDSLFIGMLPAFRRYASQVVESDISLRLGAILSRVPVLASADNDSTAESAKQLFKDIENGKLGIVASNVNGFLDGIKTNEFGKQGGETLTDLIELRNYNLASWYRFIGLNANDNMKRESINGEEAHLDEHLLPLIDDMLKQRKLAIEKVNKMFGTEITVELDNAWKQSKAVSEAETVEAILEAESEVPEEPAEETEVAEDGNNED